jgi:hypothetical protein
MVRVCLISLNRYLSIYALTRSPVLFIYPQLHGFEWLGYGSSVEVGCFVVHRLV